MLSDGGQIFVPSQQLLVHPPCDVGQDARPIHNGVFAPIPCGGDRPKKCTGTPPAPLCWPWTTDPPISRFSFLTLRGQERDITVCIRQNCAAQHVFKGHSEYQ
jgi:hypothetical protein